MIKHLSNKWGVVLIQVAIYQIHILPEGFCGIDEDTEVDLFFQFLIFDALFQFSKPWLSAALWFCIIAEVTLQCIFWVKFEKPYSKFSFGCILVFAWRKGLNKRRFDLGVF